MMKAKHNTVFRSETDTEVIAHLVGLGLDEGMSLRDSLQQALSQCDGSWGIACIHRDKPKEIVVGQSLPLFLFLLLLLLLSVVTLLP